MPEFYVIIDHLKIIAINSLVISNSLDFHYKVSRVKEVLLWLGFSRSLGRLSLTVKSACDSGIGKYRMRSF